jgi:VIT1/CCC1 family predicted Fe2+/Mn2+ transporter
VWAGTALALLGLFALGWAKGRLVRVPVVRSGLEVLAVGGVATIIGVIVGLTFPTT